MEKQNETLKTSQLLEQLQELYRKRKSYRWVPLIWIGVCFLDIGLWVVLGDIMIDMPISLAFFLFVILAVAVLIAFGGKRIFTEKINKKISQLLKDNILPSVLQDAFDSAEYISGNRLSDDRIRSVDMSLPSYQHVRGSDYIKGVYHGLPFEISYIDLTITKEREVEVEEDGEKRWTIEKYEESVFSGQWMVCELGKAIGGELFVRKRRQQDDARAEGDAMILGDLIEEVTRDAFSEEFYTICSGTAGRFMTDEMKKYIMAVWEISGHRFRLRITPEGRVHLIGHSSFHVREIANEEELATLIGEYKELISFFTDCLDNLTAAL